MLVISEHAIDRLLSNEVMLTGGEKNFLTSYQQFITSYFASEKFKSKTMLLLYMEVGTGKTLTSLVCGINGLKTKMFKRVVVLSPKSVQDEFVKNLEMYYRLGDIKKSEQEKINDKIIMIPYNANNSNEQVKWLGNLEDSLFIIDEAHLFMKSIIKVNLIPNQTVRNVGNAKRIYDMIKRLKHKKVILLTGTPSTKHPFETVPMFNLAGCDLPQTYELFNDKYVDKVRMEIRNKQDLKKRLEGIVAYVSTNDEKQQLKATELIVEDVEMSVNQYKQYIEDYKLELKERGFSNKRNIYGLVFGAKSSFHAKTFEDSIYWNSALNTNNPKDRYVGDIIIDKAHCPKVIKMFEDTKSIHGCCVFYFRFVRMYGVETMEAKLKQEGYKLAGNDADKVFAKKAKRYVLFTGDVSYNTRIKWKTMFNDKRNMYGEYIKYLILSPSGSVGVTLRNVRYLGIGSCEFQYSTIRQIMGRANRLGSHLDLPVKDRTLLNKLYLSSKNMTYYRQHKEDIDFICSREAPDWQEVAPTIERCIYQDSLLDDMINESFRQCLRDVSIIK